MDFGADLDLVCAPRPVIVSMLLAARNGDSVCVLSGFSLSPSVPASAGVARCRAPVRCAVARPEVTVGDSAPGRGVSDGHRLAQLHPSTRRCARPAVVPSGGDLLDQHAQGQVDAQLADLIAAQVVDDGVGNADRPAGRCDGGELAGVGADEVRRDRRLAFIYEQVL